MSSPPYSGRLVLIRHAESVSNVAGKIDTLLPGGPLSECGHRQADDLARLLADRKVCRVLCSPATRTVQTATAVAKVHGLDVEVLIGLRELQAGELEGRSDPEAHQVYYDAFKRWMTGERDFELPAGESWSRCRDRMFSALSTLPGPPWDSDVVIVSHAASLRILLSEMLGESVASQLGYSGNAALTEVIPLGEGRWNLGGHDTGNVDPFSSVHAPKDNHQTATDYADQTVKGSL